MQQKEPEEPRRHKPADHSPGKSIALSHGMTHALQMLHFYYHNAGRGEYCLFAALGLLALVLLSGAGCVAKQKPAPMYRLSALLDDPGFMQDLKQAQQSRPEGIMAVAPGSGLTGENRQLAFALAAKAGIAFLPAAFDDAKLPYAANSDEARLANLCAAFANPDSDIIWAMRGGYGSSRLLEGLADFFRQARRQKVLVGYSDITFLHLFLQKYGWRTVHGSMLWEMANPEKDEKNFRLLAGLLSGRIQELRYDGLQPCNPAARALRAPVEAVVTGGNLTCLAAASGSPWALDARGKILLLEDVDEPGYKIDRMLTQLRLAGHFTGVKAIILGTFSAGDKHTAFALEQFSSECPFPVFATDIFGHGPKNYPLIFNAPAVLYKENNKDDRFSIRVNAGLFP